MKEENRLLRSFQTPSIRHFLVIMSNRSYCFNICVMLYQSLVKCHSRFFLGPMQEDILTMPHRGVTSII